MPMDLQQYWGAVREQAIVIAATAPDGFVHITSKEDRLRGLVGGRVCEATPYIASRCCIDNTHRLSTPEEIEAFKAERTKREQDLAKREYESRMKLLQFGASLTPQPQPQMEPARAAKKQ